MARTNSFYDPPWPSALAERGLKSHGEQSEVLRTSLRSHKLVQACGHCVALG